MLIELRSDTFTKPTPAMLETMFNAQVGDDVFEEDPTVKSLEDHAAQLFGKEAGIFCPSGTMTNQIAIKLHTQPGHEVICDHQSHIYLYEGGGIASNSLASVRLIPGDRGRITAHDVQEHINPDNIHHPVTSLVSLENTCNRGGGSCYAMSEIAAIRDVCTQQRLALHLDGARVFNALQAQDISPLAMGKHFDTISVCLSKGLGAPVGSVLLGTAEHIRQAKRIRKVWGGGMRQAGYIAAAGLYALTHHVSRLKDDHLRAQKIAEALKKVPQITHILPVETNIIIFTFADESSFEAFKTHLSSNQILVAGFGKNTLRMVTHLDFTDDMLTRLISVLQAFRK